MKLNTVFIIIRNSEQQRLQLTDAQARLMAAANAQRHLFGDRARDAGEAPIKGVFTFKDGNIVGLRGDLYTGKPVEMLRRLHYKATQYWRERKLHELKIFDNRDVVPGGQNLILHWSAEKDVVVNLLPLYSGEFDINRKKQRV